MLKLIKVKAYSLETENKVFKLFLETDDVIGLGCDVM